MTSFHKTFVLFYGVLLGLCGAVLLYWLHFQLGYSSRQYMEFWLKFIYPFFLFCSLLLGLGGPGSPWRLPVWMMVSFYGATLFMLPGTGELLPFEILVLALLTIPGIVVSYIGAYLGKRRSHQRGQSGSIQD